MFILGRLGSWHVLHREKRCSRFGIEGGGRLYGSGLNGALTGFVRRAVLDEEYIGEVVFVGRKALLVQLQLAEAFALLVPDRPEVLQQVQLGSAGVVAQRAVVVAGLRVTRTLLFLQVLQEGRRCEHRWKERERERGGKKSLGAMRFTWNYSHRLFHGLRQHLHETDTSFPP